MKFFKKNNLFTLLAQFLVIILPFYVIIKVFFDTKLGLGFFGFFIKEFIIVLLFLSLIYEFIKNKTKPKFETLDYLIFAYFIYGIMITLYNGFGINALFYGGRYDFIFFFIFLIFRHGKNFLTIKLNKLISLFLISGGMALLLGVLIKFIIGEEILENFGYSIYVANWQFKGGVPIYHGVEGAGIRRFQGLLDGPNQMAFFIIVYLGLLLHTFRKNLEFHIITIVIALIILLMFTYSRSAMLGVGVAISLIFILNAKNIYTKYKKEVFIIFSFFIFFGIGFFIMFQDKINNIFLREGSTTGHFSRMEKGFDRFIEHPLGQGLGMSGPGFREVFPGNITREIEAYYIPESWFIQQLVEGGFIYFILFISILINILFNLYKKSYPLFGLFIAILIMNIFLHIFEATYLSILLFLFLGLLVYKKYKV